METLQLIDAIVQLDVGRAAMLLQVVSPRRLHIPSAQPDVVAPAFVTPLVLGLAAARHANFVGPSVQMLDILLAAAREADIDVMNKKSWVSSLNCLNEAMPKRQQGTALFVAVRVNAPHEFIAKLLERGADPLSVWDEEFVCSFFRDLNGNNAEMLSRRSGSVLMLAARQDQSVELVKLMLARERCDLKRLQQDEVSVLEPYFFLFFCR